MLYRQLQPKAKYNHLFPVTNCNGDRLGFGYTDFGVKTIANWAQKYAWQIAKVAKLLKNNDFLKTLQNVHHFDYSNFQYKADEKKQHIQSPACAWKIREQGINCKTYTLIASSLLHNLGINHTIRRVKYSQNGNYTHVFIVVKNKGNEYIIDGTLPQFNHTTTYYSHQDYNIMAEQKLEYIGMNAPQDTPKTAKEILTYMVNHDFSQLAIAQATKQLKNKAVVQFFNDGIAINYVFYSNKKRGLNGEENPMETAKAVAETTQEIISIAKEAYEWISNLLTNCKSSMWDPKDAEKDVSKKNIDWQRKMLNATQGSNNPIESLSIINNLLFYISYYRIYFIEKAKNHDFNACTQKSAEEIFEPARDAALSGYTQIARDYFASIGYKMIDDSNSSAAIAKYNIEKKKHQIYPKSRIVWYKIVKDNTNTGNGNGNNENVSTSSSSSSSKILGVLALVGSALALK